MTDRLLPRLMTHELLEMAKVYPIVTLVGMRQSGKTTLARSCFPEKPYVSLEDLDERKLALDDPKAFLSRYPDGAIFDEIQRAPELLSYLQGIVDEKKIMGQFILIGSDQFELHEKITQSLAGRTAILKLFPLSLVELADNDIEKSLDQLMLLGGFPKLYQVDLEPYKYYSHYCQTYLERDVRRIISVKDITTFQRFMRLCAGRIAAPVNANDLANETGVSSVTIKSWLSILEASYLILRLPPYFENFGKRMVKTPKLYFSDIGLACYLLGIESVNQLQRDPLRGKLFENLVILELFKARANQGRDPQLYYYRDKNQVEVDTIFQKGHELIPIEIKSSQTYHSDFTQGLNKFREIAKNRVNEAYVVYGGEPEQTIKNTKIINYWHTAQIVAQ